MPRPEVRRAVFARVPGSVQRRTQCAVNRGLVSPAQGIGVRQQLHRLDGLAVGDKHGIAGRHAAHVAADVRRRHHGIKVEKGRAQHGGRASASGYDKSATRKTIAHCSTSILAPENLRRAYTRKRVHTSQIGFGRAPHIMVMFMAAQTFPSPTTFTSSQSSAKRRRFISLVILVWAAIYVTSLFQPGLMDDADTVHAEAAREMVLHNDWVTLRINGSDFNDGSFRYLEKAPLMYWCVAASFKLFGATEWSARLPIALGVLALLLMVYRIGRRFYGDEGGLYAALALATGFGPFIFTRLLIPDMLVGLWLALGFDFFLTILQQIEAQQQPSVWMCWGIAATMALNVLTKGLIGLVFPLGTIFLFLLLTGRLRHLFKLRLVSSFLVFLVIAAPWHLLAGFRNPAQGQAKGFFWFYFVNEHFLRYLNKRYPADYDTVPLWLFWGLMLLWLMPWTAFVVQALGRVPHRVKLWRTGLSQPERATLLFTVWTFVIVFFFSFSSRQEYYVLPALPGLALLLGGWLAHETTSPPDSAERRSGRISSIVLVVIGVAACVACVVLAVQS